MKKILLMAGKKAVNPLAGIMSSLVSYWPLTEASDGSAAVTRLDAYQFNQLTDMSPFAPSANGHLSLTAGNKEYLTIADKAGLSLGANQTFTLMAKCKPSSVATSSMVAKAGGANNQNVEFMLFISTNKAALRVGNGTTFGTVTSAVVMSAGQTYEVFCGYDAASQRLWISVNGEAVVYQAHTIGTQDTAGAMNIGRQGGANDGLYFSGEIWDVGFSKRLITAAEITAMAGKSYPWGLAAYKYGAIQPSAAGNQFFWWDFSDTATLYQDAGKTTPADGDGEAIRVATSKFPAVREVTAPSDGVRPLYKTNIQNGLGAALWNGTNSELQHTETPDGDFTMFWVFKNLDMVKGSHIAEGGRYLAITGTGYDATPRAVFHLASNDSISGLLLNPAGWNVAEIVHSGNTWRIWANGNPIDMAGADSLTVNASTFLINRIGPSYFGVPSPELWWLDGYVGEIICYSAALDGATRAGIRAGLAAKWGLTPVYYAPYVAE